MLKVNYPHPKADFMVGPYRVKEYDRVDFVGLRIRQCLRAGAEVDAAAPVYNSYNGEFYVVTPNGNQIAGGGSSWNDWPTPRFRKRDDESRGLP